MLMQWKKIGDTISLLHNLTQEGLNQELSQVFLWQVLLKSFSGISWIVRGKLMVHIKLTSFYMMPSITKCQNKLWQILPFWGKRTNKKFLTSSSSHERQIFILEKTPKVRGVHLYEAWKAIVWCILSHLRLIFSLFIVSDGNSNKEGSVALHWVANVDIKSPFLNGI